MIVKLPEGKYLLVVNAVLFNVGWAACVLLRSPVALLVAAAVILFHLTVVSRLVREWQFILAALGLGLLVDQLLLRSNLLLPTEDASIGPVLWMGALWPMLATTLNHSLASLRDRIVLSALVGAVAGPFAYWTAVRLGAAEAGYSLPVFIIALAVLWGALLPLLYELARSLIKRPANA